MSQVGFLWREDGEWMAVRPPDMKAPIWQEWLMRQDASKRRFIKSRDGGYWLIAPDLVNGVQERFIVASWVIEYKNPYSGVAGDAREFLRGAKVGGDGAVHTPPKHTGVSPYELLFVQTNAPRCVIDAAYKSLMKEVHSDVNKKGEEASKILNNARDSIYKDRGW